MNTVIIGTVFHAFGALSASWCYTPQRKVKGWSWQTYWLSQAVICWFVAPIIGAMITIPEIWSVLAEASKSDMLITFVLGIIYGIGGISFGLAIKHIGFSLTYAIAIGLSCIIGTLSGPIIDHKVLELIDKPGAAYVILGVFVGVLGTMLCGIAGRFKEIELDKNSDEVKSFNLGIGLTLCVIAGVLSAIYGIAVNNTGAPIAAVAAKHGAGQWCTNIVYIFANSGAFVTTLCYTLWLAKREKTFREFISVKGISAGSMVMNYFWALLTGLMWYSQFLFYGLGHVRMGEYKFSSWAIHMIMLVLFSSITGLVMREWKKCGKNAAVTITLALLILVAAILCLTYGNYLGSQLVSH